MTEEIKKTFKDRYNSITSGFSMVNSGISIYNDLKTKYQENFLYTASLEEDSFVYHEVMQYINASTKSRNYKFLSTREGVWKYYDSEATAVFWVDGYKIKASLKKPEVVSHDDGYGSPVMAKPTVLSHKDELWFTCHSAEGIEALQNLLKKMTKEKTKNKKTNYIVTPDRWGEWDYENLPYKGLDTVFLPKGVKEALVADLENFKAKEDRFKAVGIPWHRGYAFYGEPGNGKSSIALGLANYFGMDLYSLPLSSVHDDKSLHNAISSVRENSFLLIEDIDIFSDSMSRQQSPNAPTLAGLLNALDGVATPNGLITIITTNHFERLDPALIRPGRIDYRMELKAPILSQISDMFKCVFDEPLGLDETKDFESMAAVADVFKRSLDDPEAVRMELKND